MKAVLLTIDEHIVSGRGAAARRLLEEIVDGKIPRSERLAVAALARRASLHGLAVRLLNPIVRPKGKKRNDATDEEKAEYAASLSYLGASEEAQLLLKTVKNVPQALLYEAFCCFAQWNYAEAIQYLQKYVEAKTISDYQRMVGKVNLAAALVYERHHGPAEQVLKELLQLTQGEKFTLLRANCLELSAQNAIHQRQWKAAMEFLANAEPLLEKTESAEKFFVQKWRAIVDFLRTSSNSSSLEKIHRIRGEAQAAKHWETMRDCDRFEAVHTQNKALFERIYFGSPYESFRARLVKDFKWSGQLPTSYEWNLKAGRGPIRLNLLTGEESRQGKRLKVGQALHRLLVTLASDFYKPARVAVVHANLFPGEYFNPITAPPRVYEIVRRLRQWLESNQVPLSIPESNGYYSLLATRPITLHIELAPEVINRQGNMGEQLRRHWPREMFTLRNASEFLQISDRSALRILDRLKKENTLERLGKGPATKYRFKAA